MSKFGQYELLDRIAFGGMAEIFRGRAFGEEGFEKLVAIKRVLPNYARDSRFVAMLVTEARIHASLCHRNIVQIHDLGISPDGEYFIVLEYVDGPDLAALLARLGERKAAARLPDPVALFVAIELGEGVHFAHQMTGSDGQPMGLVHRDISPSNVLLSYAGEVKLSDFGLAKRRTDHSVVGSLKGKLAYMSPEQARRSPLDRRSDIFSLGAVLFELLTGHPLRQISDDVSGWQQVASGLVPPPRRFRPDIPPALDTLLTRALAPDPRDRFADVRAFLDEARAALSALPRSRAGEAGELQAILKAVLPPGAPRPAKERSRVIRLLSEIAPGGLPPGISDDTIPRLPKAGNINTVGGGTEEVTLVTPPPLSSPLPPMIPPTPPAPAAAPAPAPAPAAMSAPQAPLRPTKSAPSSPPRRPTPSVVRPPARPEERRSVAGSIAVDSRSQPPEHAERPAADEQRIIAAWPSLGLSRTPGAFPEDDPGPTPPPRPLTGQHPLSFVNTSGGPPASYAPPPQMGTGRYLAPNPPLQTGRYLASGPLQSGHYPVANPSLQTGQFPPPGTRAPTGGFGPVSPTGPPPTARRSMFGTVLVMLVVVLAALGAAAHRYFAPLPVLAAWWEPARLEIRSQPSAAEVYLDGRRLSASTPTYTDVRRDRNEHTLELRRDGFRLERLLLRYDRTVDLLVDVKLTPAPPPPRP
jgi:hypothetical protein